MAGTSILAAYAIELDKRDLEAADQVLCQARTLQEVEKALWHLWRFKGYSGLDPLRVRLATRFLAGEPLKNPELELLHLLQENLKSGDINSDHHLLCSQIFSALVDNFAKGSKTVALSRNLVWAGLVELENRFGLPDRDGAIASGGFSDFDELDWWLIDAAHFNRCNKTPVDIAYDENHQLAVRSRSKPTAVAEIFIGPYFFQNLTEKQKKSSNLPDDFQGSIRNGLRILIKNLLARNIAIRPLLFWRGGFRPKKLDDCMLSFGYHSVGVAEGTWHYKFGHFPDLLQIDPAGYAGFSRYAATPLGEVLNDLEGLSDDEVSQQVLVWRNRYIERKFTWRLQNATEELTVPPDRRIIFLPLQDPRDEVAKLSRMSPEDMVAALREHASDRDLVVVKRHPVDLSVATEKLLESLAGDPRFLITKASIHKVFDLCDAVIVFNSGVGFEALLAGLPVIAAGRSDYNNACINVSDRNELAIALSSLGSGPPLSIRNRVVLHYFRHAALDPENEIDFATRILGTLFPEEN